MPAAPGPPPGRPVAHQSIAASMPWFPVRARAFSLGAETRRVAPTSHGDSQAGPGRPTTGWGRLPYARPLAKPISMRLSRAVSSAMAPAAASAGTCGDEKEGGKGQAGATPPATPPSGRSLTHRAGDPGAGVGDTDGGEQRGSGSARSVWVTWVGRGGRVPGESDKSGGRGLLPAEADSESHRGGALELRSRLQSLEAKRRPERWWKHLPPSLTMSLTSRPHAVGEGGFLLVVL